MKLNIQMIYMHNLIKKSAYTETNEYSSRVVLIMFYRIYSAL